MKDVVVIVIGLLLMPWPGRADIIEWRDADGVRHYTNLKEEIPDDQRSRAQVVVDESVRHRAVPEDPTAPQVNPPPEAPRQAQAVYDRAPLRDAYLEGVEQGMQLGRNYQPPAQPAVEISGPLAIANAAPQAAPGYLYPYYTPLVTTSFDGGRSRHLTLRMLLQDQFALERDLLFGYPVGVPYVPIVQPVLPRRGFVAPPCGFGRSHR